VLIDGIEPKSLGGDKIKYECACLDKEAQDIVWGFVLSEDRETPPTPAPVDYPPPPVQRIPAARVKVVMQRQADSLDAPSITRVQALLSDSPRVKKLPPFSHPPSPHLPPRRAALVRAYRILSCQIFQKRLIVTQPAPDLDYLTKIRWNEHWILILEASTPGV